MKKIGKIKDLSKINGFGKGWYNESVEHGLASRGIKLGRKGIPTGRKRKEPVTEKPKSIDIKPPKELIITGFIIGAIQVVPMAKELYIGYGTARLVYSSWNMIYNAYKNHETLEQETCNKGLTSNQIGLIWNNIEDRVSEPFKNKVHNQLNILLNTTEEEILLVENALATL